jgi:hypothetical protein
MSGTTTSELPLPPLNPERALDIGRGYLALAEQYRLAQLVETAREYDRWARVWLEYARTLVAVGAKP